jgi:hypothetical protein
MLFQCFGEPITHSVDSEGRQQFPCRYSRRCRYPPRKEYRAVSLDLRNFRMC